MKQGYTRIAVLLDRSGSMELLREATIEAINTFVREQRAQPGYTRMKLAQFDTVYEVIFDQDLKDVPEFTQAQFQPRGFTALWDSQCRIIDELGVELAALPEEERPEKVIVVTITDGLENQSRKFKEADVKRRIQTQQDIFNWAFVYLGANQDAIKVGTAMGIHPGASITYTSSAGGVKNAVRATNSYVNRVRSVVGGQSVQNVSYTVGEREEAMEDSPVGSIATHS